MGDADAASQGSGGRARAGTVVSDALRHPLVLLVVGALISALVVPIFTQRWQSHQKELDVKSRLVTETSEALATFRGSVQRIELAGGQPGLRDLDAAFAEWGVRSAVIESELDTYFPHNKKLLSAWNNLNAGVTGAYYVLKNDSPAARLSTYSDFRQWIGQPPDRSDPLIAYSLRHIPADELGPYDAEINTLLLFPLLRHQQAINRMILSAQSIL